MISVDKSSNRPWTGRPQAYKTIYKLKLFLGSIKNACYIEPVKAEGILKHL